jgi:hypothetical protein
VSLNECVFHFKTNGCKIMSNKRCHKQCSFYLTRECQAASIEVAYERMRRMPESRQFEISEKYYGGKMPWKREEI